MKKFLAFLSIFLFLSLSINTVNTFAETKILSQGIYNINDIVLSPGVSYSVRNTCPTSRSLLIIIDSNQMIQEFIRLEPISPKYALKPLNYGDIIVIIGAANLEFS